MLEGSAPHPNAAARTMGAIDEWPSRQVGDLHAEPDCRLQVLASLQQRPVGGPAPRRPTRPANLELVVVGLVPEVEALARPQRPYLGQRQVLRQRGPFLHSVWWAQKRGSTWLTCTVKRGDCICGLGALMMR